MKKIRTLRLLRLPNILQLAMKLSKTNQNRHFRPRIADRSNAIIARQNIVLGILM